MDKDKIAHFKEILTNKRDELRRALDRTQEQRHEVHDFGRDEGDRANTSQSKEMSFRQDAQYRGLLGLTQAALTRVDAGTFGECLSCGQEISLNRLKAVPWSQYCITCQELIAEKQ